ncbi:hypothetical protein Mgra_00000227 [Meloidogyne graminicola]|uniref:Uncharacterized protein n=1 Tax=Meloidogyne graminicola TaxID=189291 RepID=A0A8T0A3I4_9BILA|nr:hypothetical protein Mgra_00000227 [Meloidogyne graminicola]
MENFDPGLIFSSIKSNKINLNWATSNLGLLEKMRINANKKESSFPSINKLDNSQFIDETCQGKLFERRSAINDNNSQEFQIKAILSELRQNFGTNIPREIIDQLIRRYLHNNFEQFQFIRKEVFKFLMEILEANLPTTAHKRWEWVCIILSDFTEVYSDINFLYTLSNFSKIILKYFKDDKISLEFKQFFLNLLEYDYAFICLNNKNTIKDQQHLFREVLNNKRDVITVNKNNLTKKNLSTINQLPSTPRRIGIGSMDDLNNFPLIYFLLCFIKPDACNFHEHILNKLESIIVQDLLMHFHPYKNIFYFQNLVIIRILPCLCSFNWSYT